MSPLEVERRWLQSWFDGTPVRIKPQGAGLLAVEVPLQFCFDPGRSTVKPALAAVLDKLAESLRRHPAALLQQLSAPGDGAASAAADQRLARQRGDQVRSRLRSRGVAAAQIATGDTPDDDGVLLVLRFPGP